MVSETVNSTCIMRLWHSTMTKKLSLRRVLPTGTEPYWPQSTWAHSPGSKCSVKNAGALLGRTRRTYWRTMPTPPP